MAYWKIQIHIVTNFDIRWHLFFRNFKILFTITNLIFYFFSYFSNNFYLINDVKCCTYYLKSLFHKKTKIINTLHKQWCNYLWSCSVGPFQDRKWTGKSSCVTSSPRTLLFSTPQIRQIFFLLFSILFWFQLSIFKRTYMKGKGPFNYILFKTFSSSFLLLLYSIWLRVWCLTNSSTD